ncbi:MAG TPA: phosphomannomutase/phosphoglucomutase [Fibrobacteria bacterium]|nr:phosphomannomutase/phosphoglucomutase [Fibrobacteria bacterium]
MNLSIFREYDIRGLHPTELTDDTVRRIAMAFGTILRNRNLKTVSVGGDVRLHTPRLKEIFIAGLNATGIDVIDIGTVTTPLCYFSAFHLPVDGFAMITASHNPKDYNGFKIGIGKTTIFGADIVALRDLAQKGDFAGGSGSRTQKDITEEYIGWIAQRIKLSRPIQVVLDPANATGALFARKVFEGIGAKVIAINDTSDGRFPNHHPDPTVWENVVDLSKKVVETGSQVGIGLDGDSDRIGVIDETGALIPGDLLTLIFAKSILEEKPGSRIIYEVKSSMALEQEISKAGGVPVMWKVGHSLLKKKMAEDGAPLAGEVSGHVFFADKFFGFDDAIYAGCRMLEIMDKTGKTPSQLLEGVPVYHNTPEIRVGCKDDTEKFQVAEKAAAHFRKTHKVIDIDGVRILFDGGWGLVRASNTQPSLVTRFEGATPERRDEIMDLVLGQLKQFSPNLTVGVSH